MTRTTYTPRYAHICAHCNALFATTRRGRFCGVVCRQRAARRHAAGVPEDTPRAEMRWAWHRQRQALIDREQRRLAL